MYQETTTSIDFAYPIEAVFAEVSLQSIYTAKNMSVTAKGEDAVDAYGITSDEKDFFRAQLDKAITSLFSYYVKQTDSVEDSMFPSKTMNEIECCGFSIKRETQAGKSLYNPNRLKVLDICNSDFLKNYILLEWAKTNMLADGVAIHKSSLDHNIAEIRKNNFEFKKRLYGKTYEVFP